VLNEYDMDHGKYPPSIATIGYRSSDWNWLEPMTMITYYERAHPGGHRRSISAYLGDYVKDAGIMFCPSAPKEYPYMRQAWSGKNSGDDWDNPETARYLDPFYGTYCFYWGYTGLVDGQGTVFQGPRSSSSGPRRSKLLVSDYFGYDYQWRGLHNTYASCEKFYQAGITDRYANASDYWYCLQSNFDVDVISIRLHAGYTDGHVETYSATEVLTMRVSSTPDGRGSNPLWANLYGDIYLPTKSLY